MTYQDEVCLIRVVHGEGGVHSQGDAVAEDGDDDEEVEGLPLHQLDDPLPDRVLHREAVDRARRPVRRRLRAHPPYRLLQTEGRVQVCSTFSNLSSEARKRFL